MDRRTFYRDQVPTETDMGIAERYAYEAIGLLALDILGSTTVFGGLACNPTAPASLAVTVGPGRIYSLLALDPNDWGKTNGTGGVDADTNADHFILKQGLHRDTEQFNCGAPGTAGYSIVYLIEAQFSEVDDAATAMTLYNTANPNAPITANLSFNRQDKCVLQLKSGTAAPTGSQVAPAADAGWIPLWTITVANGATQITAGNIALATGAPQINVGGGGGGGSALHNWQVVTTNYTAVDKDRLILDSTGGAFTLTLPPTPAAGVTEIWVKGNFATNNVTVEGNGHSWAGFSDPLVLNKDYLDIRIVFDGTHWRI